MPVAAPGRWVKGEAKSLLGGTRPRTPAPGESARPAENAKGAEYRSTPPIARHEGDRRGSPWFSWRAIAVGCVLGALVVLAVFRAFPSVAAAVVPTPGSAVSASWQTSQAEPSSSRAAEPSAKPAKPRTTESFADIVRAHHAKRLGDLEASSGRLRASSDSKPGARADADAPLGLRKVSAETGGPPREDDSRAGEHHHHRVRRERAAKRPSSASDTQRLHEQNAAPRRAAAVEPKRHAARRETRPSSKPHSKKYRSAALGDAEQSEAAASAGGAWRSGLERNARPAFGDAAKGAPASRPAASLGAVAAAEAAARGEASGADVGDALVGDVQDSAASALRFEAGLGRQARETRRDVEGEAFLAQRRAEAQSVDPAGDALAHAREGVAQMREEHEGILAAGDDESPAARGNSGILGGDPESNAEAVANDPLVRSVFGMGVDA